MLQLRTYQQDLVNKVRQAYNAQFRAPLVVAPTGAGKTVIFSHIAQNVAARGKKALILVHRVELLRQTSQKLSMAGVYHGAIHPDFPADYMAPVQVASVQTLVRRLGKIPLDPDLLIIDEAHHATAGSWRSIINAYGRARLLGVTATPVRSDGNGLGVDAGGLFDTLVEGPTVKWLVENRDPSTGLPYLAKPIVKSIETGIDLSNIGMVAGDYNKKVLAERVDKATITGDAVAHYRRFCDGEPAVVFCVSVEHAKHVAEQFRASGYRFYSVDGEMDEGTRKRILNGLENGSVQGVCSCDLISEGTDIPAIACAILLRPTQSLGLYLQQVGRALRPVPGKERAIILDHVGAIWVHGPIEEERQWTLDGSRKQKGKKENKGPIIRLTTCKQCFCTFEPAPTCPDCGTVVAVDPNQGPKVVEGQLVEITEEMQQQIIKLKRKEVAQAQTLEELLRIEKARGYRAGWAKHVMNNRKSRAF